MKSNNTIIVLMHLILIPLLGLLAGCGIAVPVGNVVVKPIGSTTLPAYSHDRPIPVYAGPFIANRERAKIGSSRVTLNPQDPEFQGELAVMANLADVKPLFRTNEVPPYSVIGQIEIRGNALGKKVFNRTRTEARELGADAIILSEVSPFITIHLVGTYVVDGQSYQELLDSPLTRKERRLSGLTWKFEAVHFTTKNPTPP